MPSISPFITYETLHCVHQHKIKDASTSNPQNDGFNDGVPKKIAGFARVINPFRTIGLTTAIFFLLDSPVLVALFYMGQPP